MQGNERFYCRQLRNITGGRLIKLPHRLYIPLQPTFPKGKAGIESRFFSRKTDKIRNIKEVCQCNLCIAILAVEGNMELIIKGDFDTVGFGVIQCRYYFTHSHYPFFEKCYCKLWAVMSSLP